MKNAQEKVKKFIENCNEQIIEIDRECYFFPKLLNEEEILKHDINFYISDNQPEQKWIFYPDNYRCIFVKEDDVINKLLDTIEEEHVDNSPSNAQSYPDLDQFIAKSVQQCFYHFFVFTSDSTSLKRELD